MRGDRFLSRLARAAQPPGRPLLKVTLPPRLARFLIAAGAQAASSDSMTVRSSDMPAATADNTSAKDHLSEDPPSPQEESGAERAEIAIVTADPSLRLAARHSPLVVAVVSSDLILRLIGLADRIDADSADTTAFADALAQDLIRALDLAHVTNVVHAKRSPQLPALARDFVTDSSLDIALDLARDIARDLDRNNALPDARNLDRARTCARALDHQLAAASLLDNYLAREFDRNLAPARVPAIDLARVLANNLNRMLEDAMSRSLGLDRVEGLAGAMLKDVLDDFTHADLSNVVLADVDLTGLRWSRAGTRWPSDTVMGEMRQRSVESPPGSEIYVISPPGQNDRAYEDAHA
jgi:hypothetical protein